MYWEIASYQERVKLIRYPLGLRMWDAMNRSFENVQSWSRCCRQWLSRSHAVSLFATEEGRNLLLPNDWAAGLDIPADQQPLVRSLQDA